MCMLPACRCSHLSDSSDFVSRPFLDSEALKLSAIEKIVDGTGRFCVILPVHDIVYAVISSDLLPPALRLVCSDLKVA